jgi:LysM repeat protein
MLNVSLRTIALLFLMACSHMRSGQHVQWTSEKTLEEIALEQGLSVEDIKKLNPNIRRGEWLFVPNKVGFLRILDNTYIVEDYSALGQGEYMWPVPKVRKISSGFGHRWGKKHEGIDIPAPIGTPVIAVKEGVIKYSDQKIRGYGKMIVIEHPGKVFSVYAHLNKLMVRAGDKVKKGQMIAHTGNTGRSTGPHLHFEIRIKNQARDPAKFVSLKKP